MAKFVVTSGGTAGHIYPALAVAAELGQRGHQLHFAGTPEGHESRLAQAQGLAYQAFAATGFNRSRPWTLLTSSLRLDWSTRLARQWLAQLEPDAVAAFGGYVSVPVGRAAAQLGIPLLIHEQNSAAGWANRYLARQAQVVALTYEAARPALSQNPAAEVILSGNPVRQSLLEAARPEARTKARADFRAELGIPLAAHVLLVFGGSQGARHINQALVALHDRLMAVKGLHIIQITGAKELASVQAALREKQAAAADAEQQQAADAEQRWHLMGYCDQMAAAYAASDVTIARAGAGSLAEIATMGLAAILVPYPFATDDHQSANAQSLVDAGAALMVLDNQLDDEQFATTLLGLLVDIPLQLKMQQAARAEAPRNAAILVADALERIAVSKGG